MATMQRGPVAASKKRKMESVVVVETKKEVGDKITENQYLELAKSFQVLMKEKFTEIACLKSKNEKLRKLLKSERKDRLTLRQAYLRCIDELARERLQGPRVGEFRRMLVDSLTSLHSFVVNEEVGASSSSGDESSTEAESDEDE